MPLDKLLLITSFWLIQYSVYSQVVNIENKRIYDDSLGWSGSVEGGFSVVQNKDLLYNLTFRPKAQFKSKKNNFFLIGDLSYSKSADRLFANSGMLHFRHAYRIKSSTWKIESYAQVQYNDFLDIKRRDLVGAGIRDKFIDKNQWKFFAGTSVLVENETFLTGDSTQVNLRSSNYLSWYIQSKNDVRLTGATYYQPSLLQANDQIVSGQYVLGVKMTSKLQLKLEYNFYYDQLPSPGIRAFQFSFLSGFQLSL